MYNMYTHVLCTDECIQDIPNRLMRTAQGGNSVIEQWILFFQTILIPHETQMSVVQICPPGSRVLQVPTIHNLAARLYTIASVTSVVWETPN